MHVPRYNIVNTDLLMLSSKLNTGHARPYTHTLHQTTHMQPVTSVTSLNMTDYDTYLVWEGALVWRASVPVVEVVWFSHWGQVSALMNRLPTGTLSPLKTMPMAASQQFLICSLKQQINLPLFATILTESGTTANIFTF